MIVKCIRIIGYVLLLAGLLLAPIHNATASDGSLWTMGQTMEMPDGSLCPPQDCGSMPDCTMAQYGGFGSFAEPPAASTTSWFDESNVAFNTSHVMAVVLFDGEEIRRPPKI